MIVAHELRRYLGTRRPHRPGRGRLRGDVGYRREAFAPRGSPNGEPSSYVPAGPAFPRISDREGAQYDIYADKPADHGHGLRPGYPWRFWRLGAGAQLGQLVGQVRAVAPRKWRASHGRDRRAARHARGGAAGPAVSGGSRSKNGFPEALTRPWWPGCWITWPRPGTPALIARGRPPGGARRRAVHLVDPGGRRGHRRDALV